MKKRKEIKRTLFALLIPVTALAVVLLLLPYLVISHHTLSVTIYLFISVVVFLTLLPLRNYWPIRSTKMVDIIISIITWAIALPVIIIFGVLGCCVVFVRGKSIYIIIEKLSIIMNYLFGLKLRLLGEEIPNCQFGLTYNHTSTKDDFFNAILMGHNRWKIVFSPEILRMPFVSFFAKLIGIPITRTDLGSRVATMRKIIKETNKGYNILMLAEGNRLPVVKNNKNTPTDELKKQQILLPFKDGLFAWSKMTGIPISPVVISWMFLYQPRRQWWFSPQEIDVYRLKLMYPREGEDIEQYKTRVRDAMLEVLEKSLSEKKIQLEH